MTYKLLSFSLAIMLLTILSSCISNSPRLGQDQAVDIAWEALKPNTSSGKSDNWEIVDAHRTTGREVVGEFLDARFVNCPGPLPPENKAIKSSSQYWYIKVVPAPVFPPTQEETLSPANPPQILEPHIKEVIFLIDMFDGQVVARKFTCIPY